MKRPKGKHIIFDVEPQRRMRVVVTDEETGEHVIIASGVETMALVIAPDKLRGEEYRRVLIGDLELALSLLLDTLEDVLEWSGREAVLDLGDLFEELLEDAMGDLPVH